MKIEIDISLLKREYNLERGLFKGTHILYLNKEIAQTLNPNMKLMRWRDERMFEEAEAGWWIEADDGWVVQLLRKVVYKPKTNNVYHYFFRFPMCNAIAYINQSGTKRFRQFQGQYTYANKNRISPSTTMEASRKKRFASFIVAGLSPPKAYYLAFNDNTVKGLTLTYRMDRLMSDKIVQKEVIALMEPLAAKVNESFSDERLISELEQLLDRSRKGSDAHRENIKFIMSLVNKLPSHMYPDRKKNKEILDTPYEEVKPPEG